MDDISSRISQILNSPDGMDTLKSMASAFLGNNEPTTEQDDEQSLGISPEQIKTFIGLSNALKKVNTDNSTTKLLYALRPHLGNEKREKIDKAIKFMKIMSLMPVIQESGLLPFNL